MKRKLLLAGLAIACPALAQNWPAKTVRIVVPFAAGGGTDVNARILSPRLAERWGQSVVVDNRAGAGTVIGTEIVAKSPPDGYTLLLNSSAQVVSPAVVAKLPYDALADFAPITLVSFSPQALVGHPSLPVKGVKEPIALARARPNELNYGNAGPTSMLTGQLFNMLAKVNLQSIQYKGAAPMMIDIMGGHVMLGLSAVGSVAAATRTGKLRLFGIASATPSPAFPEATPIARNDLPGFDALDWFGMLAPRGTPPEIVARIQRDIAEILRVPAVRQHLLDIGADPSGLAPDEFATRVRSEIDRWKTVAQASGIKPQ